jgi:hypothetical protein
MQRSVAEKMGVLFKVWRTTGLPDGLFSNQKVHFGLKFGGPWNGICMLLYYYGNMEYFTLIWYNL